MPRCCCRTGFAACCVLALLALCCHPVDAAEVTISAEELQALVERLEKAEARIDSLQSELRQTPVPRSLPPPTPYGQGTIAPVAPAGHATVFEDDAPPEPLELRVDEIQKKFDDLSQRHSELEQNHSKLSESFDSLSSDLDDGVGIVFPGTSNATVIFNGRIHADYWAFPETDAATAVLEGEDPQDRVGFRRVRFGARGTIHDNLVYRIEMEFADSHDIEWRDNYIGFRDLPIFRELLIGNQKRPYSLDHLNSSRYNVFLERPAFIDAFNDDSRRLGIQSYGYSDDLAWNWQYGVFLLDKIQDSDPFYVSDHVQGEVAGRLAHTYWYDEIADGRGYGHFAIAGTLAHPDGDGGPGGNQSRFRARPEARSTNRWIDTGAIAGAENYQLLGLEHVFNAGPVQFVSEVQNVWLQRNSQKNLHFWGAYVYLSYFLTGEHMPWDRESGQLDRIEPFENFWLVNRCGGGTSSGLGAWQVALRYGYSDLSDEDILGGSMNSITVALNWFWNPNARMQFNYVHGWIDNSAALASAGFTQAEYDILGVRFCVDF